MLVPLRGRLIVEILNDAQRTKSGLWLAGIKEEVPHRGLVISLGAPWRDKRGKEYAWGIQPGHIVHFKRVWDQNKVKHYILKREQIYAIEHQDKAYAIGEYVIIKKKDSPSNKKIFVPSHFEVVVEEQISYGIVTSVGRENKMGIGIGDNLMVYKGEGLSVRIPLQEELWSIKSRAVLARMISSLV